jgi:hypothetical protein
VHASLESNTPYGNDNRTAQEEAGAYGFIVGEAAAKTPPESAALPAPMASTPAARMLRVRVGRLINTIERTSTTWKLQAYVA